MRRILIIPLLAALLLAGSDRAEAGRKVYSTASSFKTALQSAVPGDTIELADGSYDIGGNSLTKSGTAQQRIVIKALNRGKAELKGKSAFTGKGIAYVTIEGFLVTSDVSTAVKTESCNNVRITRNTFRLSETTSSKWLLIGGTYNIATANSFENRVDHNLFENKKQLGNYITIDGSPDDLGTPEASRDDRIDHNHFRTIGPRAANEMETIRIGHSGICRSSSRTVVEFNLFEECDGDPEIVSVKARHAAVRWNTFRRSQGTVCLRSSDSSTVEGNWFLGGGKSGTGGVRMYGSGHRVVNNYFSGMTGDTWDAPVTVTNGDAELTGSVTAHWRPQNITVAFNTFVGNVNNIQFGFTNNGSYSKPPKDLVVANNIIAGAQNPLVKIITAPSNLTYQGNILFPTGSAIAGITVTDAQARVTDPLLVFTDSLWRIAPESPAVNAAAGSFPWVITDIDGQMRDGAPDAGADEWSGGQRFNRPLTAADVGPEGPDSLVVITSVRRSDRTSPETPQLLRVFPNPFNPAATVRFMSPAGGEAEVTVTDLLGREVALLFRGTVEPGCEYAFRFDAGAFAAGTFFVHAHAGGVRTVRRILLVK